MGPSELHQSTSICVYVLQKKHVEVERVCLAIFGNVSCRVREQIRYLPVPSPMHI